MVENPFLKNIQWPFGWLTAYLSERWGSGQTGFLFALMRPAIHALLFQGEELKDTHYGRIEHHSVSIGIKHFNESFSHYIISSQVQNYTLSV
jgi:hypothetical protein